MTDILPPGYGSTWKHLCIDHAKKIMICPCWIVERNQCEECSK